MKYLVLLFVLFGLDVLAQQQWPAYNGPNGNFSQDTTAYLPLLDNFQYAKEVWQSQYDQLGQGKCCYGLPNAWWMGVSRHPAGATSLIAADGKIFVSHYTPTGHVIDTTTKGTKWRLVPSVSEIISSGYDTSKVRGVLAHDKLVAMDANSGQTLWVATEFEKGANLHTTKRPNYTSSPVYRNNKVYMTGTTMRTYCYNATTGAKLWENTLPPHSTRQAELQSALANARLVNPDGLKGSMMFADGILIGCAHRNIYGLDTTNGNVLWTRNNVNTYYGSPQKWKYNGKEYLVCNNDNNGDISLIDPQNGNIVWAETGFGKMMFSVPVGDSTLLANSSPASGNVGHFSGYKISLTGLTLLYNLPPDTVYFATVLDNGPRRIVGYNNGYYYIGHHNDNNPAKITVVEEATGKIKQIVHVTGAQDWWLAPMFIQNRVVFWNDLTHGGSGISSKPNLSWFQINPDGTLSLLHTYHMFLHSWATSYVTLMESPYMDGKMFFRAENGKVVSYSIVDSASLVTHTPNLRPKSIGLKIAPNPATNHLTIYFESKPVYPIQIFNLQGQELKTIQQPQKQQDINIDNFPTGMYLIRSGRQITKFIKR